MENGRIGMLMVTKDQNHIIIIIKKKVNGYITIQMVVIVSVAHIKKIKKMGSGQSGMSMEGERKRLTGAIIYFMESLENGIKMVK